MGSSLLSAPYVAVCTSEVENLTEGKPIDCEIVMAYIVVHEMCHHFLGPKHDQHGIFRSPWTKTDVRAMKGLLLGFEKSSQRAFYKAVADAAYAGAQPLR
ncbi:MAG: hypothetical protein U0Q18_11425 [Bryobacteraceae bacterium]